MTWPSQSLDFNPIEHAFYLLKRILKVETPRNKQQLKVTLVKAWNSISNEEHNSLVKSVGRRLGVVIASKGYSIKYNILFTLS